MDMQWIVLLLTVCVTLGDDPAPKDPSAPPPPEAVTPTPAPAQHPVATPTDSPPGKDVNENQENLKEPLEPQLPDLIHEMSQAENAEGAGETDPDTEDVASRIGAGTADGADKTGTETADSADKTGTETDGADKTGTETAEGTGETGTETADSADKTGTETADSADKTGTETADSADKTGTETADGAGKTGTDAETADSADKTGSDADTTEGAGKTGSDADTAEGAGKTGTDTETADSASKTGTETADSADKTGTETADGAGKTGTDTETADSADKTGTETADSADRTGTETADGAGKTGTDTETADSAGKTGTDTETADSADKTGTDADTTEGAGKTGSDADTTEGAGKTGTDTETADSTDKTGTDADTADGTDKTDTDTVKDEGTIEEAELSNLGKGTTQNEDESSAHEILLTPWWDLEMGVGERVEVDCGVLTEGHPDTFKIQWILPNGTAISNMDRFSTHQKDKNGDDTNYAAYSVLTLSISDLTEDDSGTYTCMCTHTNSKNIEETHHMNITITVLPADERCGFESSTLCGWTISETSEVHWHIHNASDASIITRSKGPRHDHTYGLSKHSGHFLDVDVEHGENDENGKAHLLSPTYKAHTETKCLQFWYMFDGSDQEHFAVFPKPLDTELDKLDADKALFTQSEDQKTTWNLAQVEVSPQAKDYQFVFEVVTCTGKCAKAAAALDDVKVSIGTCEESNTQPPDTPLKLRLVNGNKPTEGRVEVLHDGEYGTICSEQFGDNDAKVICKMLGFGFANAIKKRDGHFGAAPDNYMIWLNKVGCTEQDEDILQCLQKNETWGQTKDCTHEQDAGVICEDAPVIPISPEGKEEVKDTEDNKTPEKDTTEKAPLEKNPPAKNTSAIKKIEEIPETGDAASSSDQKALNEGSSTPTPAQNDSATNDTGSEPKHLQENTSHSGLVAGVVIVLILASVATVYLVYRRKKRHRKSKYLNFGNPSYSTEHLPSNDFNLESPLTLNSNGYTVLA